MEIQSNQVASERIALYCRVSNGQTQTTENQKIRLLQYVSDRNLKFDLFEETESSRKTRPVKQRLLSKLRNKEYKSVVVYKLDRWARSSTELILDTKELIDKGIGFISITDNLDFSTATGKLHFQILCAFAEFERELIRERTLEGLHRTKTEGTILGRPKGSKDKQGRKKVVIILEKSKKDRLLTKIKGFIRNFLIMNNCNNSFIINISGLKYHLNPNEFPVNESTVLLIPEPNNQYNRKAIGIYDVYLKKIGYIPKIANCFIGGKISWKPYFAKVKSVYQDLGTILIKIDF